MRAIVLSGGGAKGAYQIGVWRALLKLNIKYDIVTGTSVGALNAALMTQKTYLKGLLMWRYLKFSDVTDVDIENNIVGTYVKNIAAGGLDVTALEHTIDKNLNIKKIYHSNINMGIVTVKLKNLEPVILTKEDIKPNELKNYLIASASCYPIFKKKNIKQEDYVDGGLFDNLPINLAIKMGANEVIAVDLKEIGIKQKVVDENIPITVISPRNEMGSFLLFSSKATSRAIKFGYNDTMKTFNKLDGDKFTFKKDDLIRNYKKYKDRFQKLYKKNIDIEDFNKCLEKLGFIFELDESRIYNIEKYNKKLLKKLKQTDESLTILEYLKENKLRKLVSNKYVIKYMYELIKNNDEKLNKIAFLLPNEYKYAIYLTILEDV